MNDECNDDLALPRSLFQRTLLLIEFSFQISLDLGTILISDQFESITDNGNSGKDIQPRQNVSQPQMKKWTVVQCTMKIPLI